MFWTCLGDLVGGDNFRDVAMMTWRSFWYILNQLKGGLLPVTAAPPFRGLAVYDLANLFGPVYVRKVRGCNR